MTGSDVTGPLAGIDDWPVPNAAAAAVRADGRTMTRGDQDQVFALASLTKPLTALATLVAVEEGAVELDAPLAGQAGLPPNLDLPGATLRQLLAHASGLAPDKFERAAEPGTRRIYSNSGFDLIGRLVAAATGIDFARYLTEAVLEPLALASTRLDGSPASGGHSSVHDYAVLASVLLRHSPGLLDPTTLADATTVQFPGLRGVLPGYGGQPHNDWGLGFEIRDHKDPHWTAAANSPATFGHFGRAGTMFWVDPAAGVAVVALTDRDFDQWAIDAWPALSAAVLSAG